MANIHLNSPGWSVAGTVASRGTRAAAGATETEFPPEFLTDESEVAEEFTAQAKTATRDLSEAPDALDFSYDLAAGEAAILSIRHPSGALTFHLPVPSAGRGVTQPNQVRFAVTVRSTDIATGQRGLASKAVKAILIKVGKVVADKAVSFVLPKLAAAFEKNTWDKHGLKEGWLKVTSETLANKALTSGKPISTERSLLFIHGTFSNAASAYGALATSNFFDRIKSTYGDRIFAFDHFTVSRTPEENARMLLEDLPDKTTTFDVITHSRGGLVLRNLVERANVFGPLARRFELGRAILVASPNEGTPLATPQRWGETVGWIANLLELFPDNPFTTGAAFVANGLVWLARHASGDLPGLHSMDGTGELIAELQRPHVPPIKTYSALVANYNPSKEVLLRMLDTGIDQFFGSANDLVVPTESGWRVSQSGKALIPGERIGCYGPGGNISGDSITHVNFFSQAATVDFLVKALSGEQQMLRLVEPLAILPDRRLVREAPGVSTVSMASASGVEPRPMQAGRNIGQPAMGAPKGSIRQPLKVTVVNGDLSFEKEPLLLGHYRATRLTGTEKVMNDLIGGAMKVSLDLGLYPLAPDSHQIFLNTQANPENPTRMPRPKAVIVVGLGEEGKLKAADLVHTVRQAVMAWSQRMTELDKKAPAYFDLATTLLGSGGTGVTAGQAAQRIAQGVYEANELLSGDRGKEGKIWPRVRELRLIELYLDRATEAWRALKMQAGDPDRYQIVEEIRTGTGPLPRPLDSGYRGTNYDFITAVTVQEKGQTSIQYTLDTKRARSEVRAQRTQGQLLRDLVSTASNAQNHDPQIGRTLFQLLVPVEIEAFLDGTGEMQIELDRETAGIPWELLDTGHADERDPEPKPWAIRSKLLRKLRTTEYRSHVKDATPDSSVLVIGEPACPAEYPRLPGARAEAVAVVECLTTHEALKPGQIKGLLSDNPAKAGPDARTVINALLERDWRIVHIAGHGQLPAAEGTPGGVVLSNGVLLGPYEIQTMRTVPELVFVNCCHLGAHDVDQLPGANTQTLYDRAQFASGVADKLIEIGVRCVIAAGWAVDDTAARTFATTFYGSLLRGNRFIDAVAEAREKIYSKDDNTWAAYQCYGDPDWIFQRESPEADSPRAAAVDEFTVASAAALKLVLETIIIQTKFQKYKPQTQLERIRSLEKEFGEKWGNRGCVAQLFGAAHLAVGNAAGAVTWYERAVSADDGTASMAAAEQLANAQVRLAWDTVEQADKQCSEIAGRLKASRGASAADKKARAGIQRSLTAAKRKFRVSLNSGRQSVKEATTLLKKLAAVHPTMERENMQGSAYKRLAMIEATAGRSAEERMAIDVMTRHYQCALVFARERELPDLFYPALNYLAADLVLNVGQRGWKGLEESVVEEALNSLEAKSLADPDFWSIVGQTELQLYQAIAAGALANQRELIEKGYRDLNKRVSAVWMWSSVYDTTHFVLQRYRPRGNAKESEAAETILAGLKAFAHPA